MVSPFVYRGEEGGLWLSVGAFCPPALGAVHRPRGSPRGSPRPRERLSGRVHQRTALFWLVVLRLWLFLRGFPGPTGAGLRGRRRGPAELGALLLRAPGCRAGLQRLGGSRCALPAATPTAPRGGSAARLSRPVPPAPVLAPPSRWGPAAFGERRGCQNHGVRPGGQLGAPEPG